MRGQIAQVALAKLPDAALLGVIPVLVFRLNGKAFLTEIKARQFLFVLVDGAARHLVVSGSKVGRQPADETVAVERFCLDAQAV